jgi:hypothetical protein
MDISVQPGLLTYKAWKHRSRLLKRKAGSYLYIRWYYIRLDPVIFYKEHQVFYDIRNFLPYGNNYFQFCRKAYNIAGGL